MSIFVSDLTHFLDASGELAPGRPGRLGAFLARIVAVASGHPVGAVVRSGLRCRRRPRHVPCEGQLLVLRRDDGVIEWGCPVCDDQGAIHHWQGTRWDRSAQVPSNHPQVIPLETARARSRGGGGRGSGRSARRTLSGGQAAGAADAGGRMAGGRPAADPAVRGGGSAAGAAGTLRPGPPRAAFPAAMPAWSEVLGTWVEVDLGRVRQNVALLRAHLSAGSRLMAVVKAAGYGHGAEPVAPAALEAGAAALGVARVEEGLALRAAGIAARIVVLGWTPRARAGDVAAAVLDQAVFDLEDAAALSAAAQALGRAVRVHAKVDTGMGRLGWTCRTPAEADRVAEAILQVARLPGLELAGVFTHLASADAPDLASARAQLAAFQALLAAVAARGLQPEFRHCANTAALLRLPESHMDFCRAGIGLYGYSPVEGSPVPLRPVMAWYARVAQVRELRPGDSVSYGGTYVAERAERVATVSVGYADGFPRLLSNRGTVLVGGHPAPVRGRVCMDQIVVGLDGCGPVQAGDLVTLIGEGRWADALAAEEGTIAYEVLCAIGSRVPRLYRG